MKYLDDKKEKQKYLDIFTWFLFIYGIEILFLVDNHFNFFNY